MKTLYDVLESEKWVTPRLRPGVTDGVTNGVTAVTSYAEVTPKSDLAVTGGVTANCSYCHKSFTPKQSTQKFCHVNCRVAAHKRQQTQSTPRPPRPAGETASFRLERFKQRLAANPPHREIGFTPKWVEQDGELIQLDFDGRE